MAKLALVLLCGWLAGASAAAADVVQHETLELAPGAPVKKLSGKIKGYSSVEYTIAVPAAGTLDLKLKSGNPSNYFNVSATGAQEALFVGSRDGSHFSTTAPAAASYKVSVYLMRNAARRSEQASFVLEAAAHPAPPR